MHMTIRLIVPGEDREDAVDTARMALDRLTEREIFDYYTVISINKDRKPYAVKADSKTGKKLIKDGMDATERDFMFTLQAIKKVITEKSDQALREDRGFRYHCSLVGQYAGSSVWVYDKNDEGVRTLTDLHNLLNGDDRAPMWVVLADVHY